MNNQDKECTKRNKQHGMSNSKLYKTYYQMKQRCENKNSQKYKLYGEAGIKVEWKSFDEFRKDMEVEYDKHIKLHGEKNTTIERIDSRGNYSKQNCRWATYAEQNNNRSINRLATINGKTQSVSDWCKELELKRNSVYSRLWLGWDLIEALTTPTLIYNRPYKPNK